MEEFHGKLLHAGNFI